MRISPPLRSALLPLLLCALPACQGSAAASTGATAPPAPARAHVATIEAREQPMPSSLALTGTLRGQRQTELAANAAGRVVETFVERGAEVKKGDLLARLDVRSAALSAAEARAAVELSRAQSASAKRECDRYAALLSQSAIGQAEYDRVADQCKVAPLSAAAAEIRASAAAQIVGDGSIRAPFAGLVTERYVEVGEYVRPDSRVVSLASIDTLRLELTVPEASVAAVKPGGVVTFSVTAYPDRTFTGALRFVGAAVRETTRDLVAEAEVPNPDRALRPGMFASVSLLTGDAPATVIPKDAILAREGRALVFAAVDHRLEERVVQLGPARGDVVAVLRGVRPGDKLVEKPGEATQNGQAVE